MRRRSSATPHERAFEDPARWLLFNNLPYKKRNGTVSSHSSVLKSKTVCLDASLGEGSNLAESGRIGYGDVRQDLAVNLHVGFFEAEDEFAVRQPVETGSRVDTGDPQTAEITLFDPAVAESVIKGPIHCFGRTAEQFAPCAPVALGKFQYLVASASRFESSFYAWHVLLLRDEFRPIHKGRQFLMVLGIGAVQTYFRLFKNSQIVAPAECPEEA